MPENAVKTRKKTQNFQGKMQVLTEVVEPNEDNVQRPTETTEEWEAAPGGVFAPVRPDTSIAGKGPGKAPKAAHRRVHPYRRPSPKEPVPQTMHWSQTESSKWSRNCLLRDPGPPFSALQDCTNR